MSNFLFKVMIFFHRLVKGLANRILDKRIIRPRNFSNTMLKKYSKYFSGKGINISGWKDADGEGGFYRYYFSNISDYSISNVKGQKKGLGSVGVGYQEIELDLTKNIPNNLVRSFDLVFNHTTLEHIFDFSLAFKNLCLLSSDIVVIVVPVMQQIHHSADFGDYWRPTTMTIAKLFLDNGLKPLVIKCNDQPFAPIYCFAIGSKKPELYKDLFSEDINFQMGAYNYGSSLKSDYVNDLLNIKQ